MDIFAVVSIAASLFFIMDPFASLPMFISVTKGLEDKTVKSYCNRAILVAGILLFTFIFIGEPMMDLFGISMDSFRVAGGLVLIMMGIELIFALKLSSGKGEEDAPWVIIATPVLTGPGVITASILFSTEFGIPAVILAGLISLIATWLLLRCAPYIMRAVGEKPLNITSRIIGLLIAGLGVEYIFQGSWNWIVAQDVAAAMMFF